MIRVALVSRFRHSPIDGVGQVMAALVKRLPLHDVKVEVWSFTPEATAITQSQLHQVQVFDLPKFSKPMGVLRGLRADVRQFVQQRQSQLDLVHLHSVFIPENLAIARLLTVPALLTPHGGYRPAVMEGSNRWLKQLWMRSLEQSMIQSMSALHAVSSVERAELLDLVGRIPVHQVENGVDLPVMDHLPARRSRELVYLGRLAVEHKGLDRLLNGFAHYVKQSGDTAARLTLAGPDFRGGRAALTAQAGQLGVVERVSFPGPVHEEAKRSLLERARAFVLTSRWEGLPVSALEALAHALPVLLTEETNIAQVVRGGGAGVVVGADAASIADGIGQLLNADEASSSEMSRRARQLAETRFDWAHVAANMAELYARVVRDQPMPRERTTGGGPRVGIVQEAS